MNPPCGKIQPTASRREFLLRAGGGFGTLAAAHLLGLDGLLGKAEGSTVAVDPLSPLAPP